MTLVDDDDPNLAARDLVGIAPNVKLLDIRVFDGQGDPTEIVLLTAMAFVRWLHRRRTVNDQRIDGVNLSLSVPFSVDNSACGWTPACAEADRMVRDGMIVCVAAGNAGYDASASVQSLGTGFRSMSISDPGNTESVITVGATHRSDPHAWGPIARSARGPTADGRHKPDLLAPGHEIAGPVPRLGTDGRAVHSGTSQATAHVSGVAALLVARFAELRGRPVRVKEILTSTATDLGRLPDFQGAGVVDAFRALQKP